MNNQTVTIVGVGDVVVQRDEPSSAFTQVSKIFREADIAFCNLEAPLCDKDTPRTSFARSIYLHIDPPMIEGYKAAGFNLVSLAGTHSMDFGPAGFVQTMEILKKNNIPWVGGGRNIEEARSPKIYDLKGQRIAFLGYHSYDQYGLRASPSSPGQNTVRIGAYLPSPHVNREEMEEMLDDVARAKSKADLVIISWHWGQSMTRQLAPHEVYLGHAAIDAGADLILGHHAHLLQAVEVYKGKAIFYSLGNFVFDMGPDMETEAIIAKVQIANKTIQRVSFLPAFGTQHRGQAQTYPPDSEKGRQITAIMKKLCDEVGTRLSIEGDEEVIEIR